MLCRQSSLYLGIDMYVLIHLYMQKQFMNKEAMNLNGSRERNVESFVGRKGKGEML